MSKEQKLTYVEAMAELEKIQAELESAKMVNMDEVTGQVKRAAELIDFCKKQLHVIDVELEKVLAQLD